MEAMLTVVVQYNWTIKSLLLLNAPKLFDVTVLVQTKRLVSINIINIFTKCSSSTGKYFELKQTYISLLT